MNTHGWVSALAAIAVCAASASSTADDPEGPRLPPRMIRAPGGYDDCWIQSGQPAGQEEKFPAMLNVAADGGLSKISLPETAPEWMVELTGCVLRRTGFRAALRDGAAVESIAILPITFVAGGSGDATVPVVKVGPLITSPTMRRDARGPLECHPVGVNLEAADARQVVQITILPDGSMSGLKLQAGSPEWLEGSARCILSQLAFFAGTVDGLPVTSEATLPIVFADAGMQSKPEYRITAPRLDSTDEEVEAAYRACYPPDMQSNSRVHFRFAIGAGGHVRDSELVLGSGDARVDEVAHCVLAKLRFTPLLRGSRRLASTVTWPLWVRPPRNP